MSVKRVYLVVFIFFLLKGFIRLWNFIFEEVFKIVGFILVFFILMKRLIVKRIFLINLK